MDSYKVGLLISPEGNFEANVIFGDDAWRVLLKKTWSKQCSHWTQGQNVIKNRFLCEKFQQCRYTWACLPIGAPALNGCMMLVFLSTFLSNTSKANIIIFHEDVFIITLLIDKQKKIVGIHTYFVLQKNTIKPYINFFKFPSRIWKVSTLVIENYSDWVQRAPRRWVNDACVTFSPGKYFKVIVKPPGIHQTLRNSNTEGKCTNYSARSQALWKYGLPTWRHYANVNFTYQRLKYTRTKMRMKRFTPSGITPFKKIILIN